MNKPGALLASGRDSDIFEYGDKLVLRRARGGRSMAVEARTMEYARANGYPVPAVAESSDDGCDLVMERISGPVMLAAASRRPWAIRSFGTMLGDLHRRLHEIPAPVWVDDAPSGRGTRLLHLDLHPLNVILSSHGPVVIDWTRASRGAGATDVAATWVLLASAGIPAGRMKAALLGTGRAVLVNAFLSCFDRAEIVAQLADVVAWKAADPNMTDAERRSMDRLARDHG